MPADSDRDDGSMMQSKKAKAFLLSMPTWTILILVVLAIIFWQVYHGQVPSIWVVSLAMVMSIIKGFLEVGYIGGTAWLDSYKEIAKGVVEKLPTPPAGPPSS